MPSGQITRGASRCGKGYASTGQQLYVETGLYYYGHRIYHAQLGRFASRDPVGYEGSYYQLYQYVQCRVTTATDPNGLEEYRLDRTEQDSADAHIRFPWASRSSAASWSASSGARCKVALYDGDDSIGGSHMGDTLKCGAGQMVDRGAIPVDENGRGIDTAISVASERSCCIEHLSILDHGGARIPAGR